MEMKVESKQCIKCEKVKPLTEFYTNKNMKDGRLSQCKKCQSEATCARIIEMQGTFERKTILAKANARISARKYAAVDTLTLAEIRQVFSADHCDYCDKHLEQSEKTLEHVIPFEYGGENTFGNVTLACLDCNRKKHTTPAFEFILLNGDANAARRLLNVLAERNGMEPQDYLYMLAQAGIEYRKARIRRIVGVDQ